MSCHTCQSSPCACNGTSGTVWQTPSPGSVAVLPFGSKAIQTPQKYPCNPEQVQATAVGSSQSSSGTSTGVSILSSYPTLAAEITTPNIGLQGQFRSANAFQWAIPGLGVWIPPFGMIKILGVVGDLVTYENLTIPSGTTINGETILVPSGKAPDPEPKQLSGGKLRRSIIFDTPFLLHHYDGGTRNVTLNLPLPEYDAAFELTTEPFIFGLFQGNVVEKAGPNSSTPGGQHYLNLNDYQIAAISAGPIYSPGQTEFGPKTIKLTKNIVVMHDVIGAMGGITYLELAGYAV